MVGVHFIFGTREEVASTFRMLQSSLAQVVFQSVLYLESDFAKSDFVPIMSMK